MPHGNLFTVTPGPVAVLIAVDQQRWEEWRMTDVPNAQGYFRRWLNAFIFCHVPGEFGSILARCEGRLLDSGGRVIGQVERGEHLGFGGFAVDDDDGRFSRFVGICLILNAQLWGAYYVLIYAWEAGFHQVVLDLDSLEAICILMDDFNGVHSLQWHLQELCSEIGVCVFNI
ncbi:hypothetical protein V6N11_065079 [Hibiscus sabdariffa]|uniref:RNase H type-1 domain-containing protein n=1 Tax=Hibiscus sabdariffa TaxID=183260 RepID=A0ABR2SIZ8_9ROSI